MEMTANGKTLPPSSVLNTILNGANTFLYVSDLQTDEILFINENMKKHFGLDEDTADGVCWRVLQSGFAKRCDFCPIPQLLQNENEVVVWEEHNTLTGRYYKNIDRLIEWSDGRKAHLQHSTDITDIRRAEMALQKRLKQQELMSVISQSFTTTQGTPGLIYNALRMAGEFMGVNQAFLSKYQKDEGCLDCLFEWYDEGGQSYMENAGRWPITPDMDIYRDLTVNGFAAINDYYQLAHPNFQMVKDYKLRAFLNIPVEISGEFWGIIGFVINEREYHWSESDIHLGKLLAGVFSGAVSRNIAQEKLIEAKKTAEQASQAKGKFLSHMSHEMRTPMNAIIGMTEIAKNSGDPQKMEYCLERIDNASKQLLGLINDILDVSKIEANKLTLSPVEFDFERMLVNIAGVVNYRVEEKNQNLIINVDKEVPGIFIGDEMRLSQVIINLLSNATKFAPEEGVIILNARVESSADADENLALRFEVIDNGIGISKNRQDSLFDPFEQADGSIVRKYGGTGLGLAISKGIVELMEGQIGVESEPEKGAKFSFTVKLKIGKNALRPELCATIDKDGIRVLAVDKEPQVQKYFKRTIAGLGIECDAAGSGEAALEMIKRQKYNLFFLDCMLPGLDGVELTKRIKAGDSESMVVMSIPQNDWSNIEQDAVSAGVDKTIFKPFFLSTLIDIINAFAGVTCETEKDQVDDDIYDFEGCTILAAEDIEINREILSAVLERTGISIDFAYDGAQAVSMFRDNHGRYSLILMDIQMPNVNGYEASQQIRSLETPEAKSIPIIAMTAHVYREDIEKCMEAGMSDHIGKPIDLSELLAKLNVYLNSKK